MATFNATFVHLSGDSDLCFKRTVTIDADVAATLKAMPHSIYLMYHCHATDSTEYRYYRLFIELDPSHPEFKTHMSCTISMFSPETNSFFLNPQPIGHHVHPDFRIKHFALPEVSHSYKEFLKLMNCNVDVLPTIDEEPVTPVDDKIIEKLSEIEFAPEPSPALVSTFSRSLFRLVSPQQFVTTPSHSAPTTPSFPRSATTTKSSMSGKSKIPVLNALPSRSPSPRAEKTRRSSLSRLLGYSEPVPPPAIQQAAPISPSDYQEMPKEYLIACSIANVFTKPSVAQMDAKSIYGLIQSVIPSEDGTSSSDQPVELIPHTAFHAPYQVVKLVLSTHDQRQQQLFFERKQHNCTNEVRCLLNTLVTYLDDTSPNPNHAEDYVDIVSAFVERHILGDHLVPADQFLRDIKTCEYYDYFEFLVTHESKDSDE